MVNFCKKCEFFLKDVVLKDITTNICIRKNFLKAASRITLSPKIAGENVRSNYASWNYDSVRAGGCYSVIDPENHNHEFCKFYIERCVIEENTI